MPVDEAELRKAWEVTLQGDPDALDPGASYHPPERPSVQGSGPGGAWGLLTSLRDGTATDDGGLVTEAVDAPTLHTPPPDPSSNPAPPEPGPPAPVELPPSYELREVIGRGGMGVVFRAVQTSLQREVAVKKLHPNRGTSALEARFMAEAMVGGLLDHPNVLPVHDLGRTGRGELLIAMKLARGPSWKRLLHPDTDEEKARAARMDRRAHLEVLLAVCNAVAYAHQKGVAHLDIKPENVLVGDLGEVLVMDWGMAVTLDDALERPGVPHRSSVRAPCGTPAYMPPELAEGDGTRIGTWTDTYLLGSTLHELITGAPPHRGKSVTESILKAIRGEGPSFGPDVAPELAGICRRALQPRPADRFQRATDLRDAVAEHLRHADSVRVSDEARRALERARAAQGASNDQDRAARYADFAEAVAGFRQAQVLWAGNPEAHRGEAEARRAYAVAALQAGDLGLAAAQSAALRAQSTGAGESAEAADLDGLVRGAEAERARVALAARRTRLALFGALAAIGVGLTLGLAVVDGQRRIAQKNELAAREAEARESSAREEAERRLADSLLAEGRALSGTGQWHRARERLVEARALLTRANRSLLPVDLALARSFQDAPEATLTLDPPHRTTCAAFADEGDVLATGDVAGRVRAIDRRTGATRFDVAGHGGGVSHVAVSLDGLRVASGGADGVVRVWDVTRGAEVAALVGHDGRVFAVALSGDGLRLVSGGADRTMRVWDLATRQETARSAHDHPVTAVAINWDGVYAASAAGREVRVFHTATPNILEQHTEHTGLVTCVALGPGDLRMGPRTVLSGGEDHTLVLSVIRSGADRRIIAGHAAPVRAVAFESAEHALSMAADGTLRRWNLTTGDEVAQRPVEPLVAAALSPDLRRAALVGVDGRVRVHDLGRVGAHDLDSGLLRGSEALVLAEVQGPTVDAPGASPVGESLLERVAVDPDGEVVLGGGAGGLVRAWDGRSGRPLMDLGGHAGRIVGLDVARPLGTRDIAGLSASRDASLVLWDLTTGLPRRRVVLPSPPRCGAFSDDGLHALTGHDGGDVLSTDLRTWQSATYESGHEGPVSALDHAHGLLLTGGDDGGVRLRQLGPGLASTPLPGRGARVLAVALSRDHAAAGTVDGTLTVWDTRTREARWSVRGHSGPVIAARFAGGSLLTSGGDGRLSAWDPTTGTELGGLTSRHSTHSVDASPDGRFLVIGGPEGLLWDLGRVARREALRPDIATAGSVAPADLAARGAWYAFVGAHEDAAHLLHRAADGGAGIDRAALVASQWRTGRFADAAREVVAGTVGPLAKARLEAIRRDLRVAGSYVGSELDIVRGVAFTHDGGRVVATSRAATISVWDARSGVLLRRMRHGSGHDLIAFTLAPDGRHAVTGADDGTIVVWDLETGVAVRTREVHRHGVTCVVVLPDGTIVSGARDKTVRVWPLALVSNDAGDLRTIGTHGHDVRALAVSPDGRRIVTADNLYVLHVWDFATGERVATLEGAESCSEDLAFLPDGSVVAASGGDLLVWAPGQATTPRALKAEESRQLYDLALSPDAKRVVTGSSDSLRVWDLAGGHEVRAFDFPALPLTAGWSPRGDLLVTGLRSGEVRLVPAGE